MSKNIKVDKPWGYELWFIKAKKYVGKVLFVRKGHRLSLQYHEKRYESFYVLEGLIKLTLDEIECIVSTEAKSVDIKPNTKHRIEALEDAVIVEIGTPEVDDVVRLEDDYGRVKLSDNT